MDVAVVKKEYADAAPTNKTGKVGAVSIAEKLIGEFSAAVAARISKTGSTTVAKGKSALMENLNPKFEIPREAPPPRETRPQRNEPLRTDPSSSRPRPYSDNAPSQRDNAPVHEQEKPSDPHTDNADNTNTTVRDNAPAKTNERGNASDTQNNADGKAAAKPLKKDTSQSAINTSQQAALVASIATPVVLTPTGGKSDELKGGTGKATKTPNASGETAPQKGALSGVNPAQKGPDGKKAAAAKAKGNAETPLDLSTKDKGQNKKSSDTKTKSTASAKAAPTQPKTQNATLAQQQAADLARKVGSNQNINVNVSVAKKTDKLTSQPAANLSGPTILNDTTDKSTQTTAKAATKGPGLQKTPTMNLNQQNGQQGANTQSQNQSQAQAALAAAANFADGRTQDAQKASGGGTSQAVKTGGAEAAPTANAAAAGTENPAQAQRNAAPTKPPAPPRTPPQQRVSEQVTVQIAKGLSDGLDTIRIQLKPAHLGLVDVRLEMNKNGHVSVVVSADNKNTLNMLKQDSQNLQRALRDAGLQMGAGDLNFSMRDQGGQSGRGNTPWETDTARTRSPERRSAPLREPTLDELLQTGSSHKGIVSKDRVDITA